MKNAGTNTTPKWPDWRQIAAPENLLSNTQQTGFLRGVTKEELSQITNRLNEKKVEDVYGFNFNVTQCIVLRNS